jgi:hypothetical protein
VVELTAEGTNGTAESRMYEAHGDEMTVSRVCLRGPRDGLFEPSLNEPANGKSSSVQALAGPYPVFAHRASRSAAFLLPQGKRMASSLRLVTF